MANVSITGACNRRCSYCFAEQALQGQRPMSAETFASVLAWLSRSGVDEIRLLGGEPTLHPQFGDFVARAVHAGLCVVVFSNGLMNQAALDSLLAQPADRLRVVVNASALLEGGQKGENNGAHVEKVLGQLAGRALLGLSVDRMAIPADALLDAIDRCGLQRTLRVGLAHPTLEGHNHTLPLAQLRAVGQLVAHLARQAHARGITLDLDCGFVPCMFEGEESRVEPAGFAGRGTSREGMGTRPGSHRQLPGVDLSDLGRRCNPLPDVLPDGRVVSCFPLASAASLPFPESATVAQIQAQLAEPLRAFSQLGIFANCGSCNWLRAGQCLGGCRSTALRRLRPSGSIEMLAADRASSPARESWAIPYVDQPLEFWQQLRAEAGPRIREVYFPGTVLGSGRPPQPAVHLQEFLAWGGLPTAVLLNPITLPQPVESLADDVIADVRRLRERTNLRAATLAHVGLAQRIRAALPELELTASTLLEVASPIQVAMLGDCFDVLVPSGRLLRSRRALRAVRQAFAGRLRLMVNEGCLPGCPYRVQHFQEMQSHSAPGSLCNELLQRQPWLRLTGAWVLPQHLHLLDGLYDELKLDGRATLHDGECYLTVLRAYLNRTPLGPHQIGGGPASVLMPIEVDESFFRTTLDCEQRCHECDVCRSYGQSL